MSDERQAAGREPAGGGAFALYLRTGRLPRASVPVEMKFNPWHDPEDGRFTFRGQGVRYGSGGATGDRTSSFARFIRLGGGARARFGSGPFDRNPSASAAPTPPKPSVGSISKFSPLHPGNHSIHVVRNGENLTKIAKTRTGLRISDLAELNGLDPNKPIRPGQNIKLPNQAYLDAGKAARDNFVRLEYYRQRHDGKLPPDPSNAPDINDPVNWTRQVRNGYSFALDGGLRPRDIEGIVSVNTSQRRSRLEQLRAGGEYRRENDEGGHYIARVLNGPTDAFNHFAQNRNFNRSGYRTLENRWKNLVQSGRRVKVRIVPKYSGASLRPSSISVTYWVGGKMRRVPDFPNESGN